MNITPHSTKDEIITGALEMIDGQADRISTLQQRQTILVVLLGALAETTCNARDFYPQGDEAWHQARFERAEALAKLDDVIGFAEAWVEHTNSNH